MLFNSLYSLPFDRWHDVDARCFRAPGQPAHVFAPNSLSKHGLPPAYAGFLKMPTFAPTHMHRAGDRCCSGPIAAPAAPPSVPAMHAPCFTPNGSAHAAPVRMRPRFHQSATVWRLRYSVAARLSAAAALLGRTLQRRNYGTTRRRRVHLHNSLTLNQHARGETACWDERHVTESHHRAGPGHLANEMHNAVTPVLSVHSVIHVNTCFVQPHHSGANTQPRRVI